MAAEAASTSARRALSAATSSRAALSEAKVSGSEVPSATRVMAVVEAEAELGNVVVVAHRGDGALATYRARGVSGLGGSGRLLAGGAITTRGALEQITVMGVRRHPRASNAPEPANDSCIFINRPVFIRHFTTSGDGGALLALLTQHGTCLARDFSGHRGDNDSPQLHLRARLLEYVTARIATEDVGKGRGGEWRVFECRPVFRFGFLHLRLDRRERNLCNHGA